MSIALDDLADDSPAKDFRRANGAPMVHRLDGSGKWDRYSRPSSMGGDLDDESNLVNWRIDRAMDGIAMNPSLATAVIAKQGQKEGRKELREKAIQAGRGEEAADLGTNLHAITQRYEEEDGIKVPPPYDKDIAAYISMLDRVGFVSEYIEVKICSDDWRAAGTADRIYKATKQVFIPGYGPLEPGQMIIADLKTGARLDYSFRAFCIQTTIYVDGCFYNVETNERSPFPDELRTDVALLVHLPVGEGRCDLHWVDCELGREGARLVKEVRAWRKRTDQTFDFVYDPVEEETPIDPVGITYPLGLDQPTNDDEWVSAMLPFAQERINTLGRFNNDARNLLLRQWPEGVRALRECRPKPDELEQILNVLDAVEAAYGVPWPEGDPRVGWHRGLHKSLNRNSNQAPMEQ